MHWKREQFYLIGLVSASASAENGSLNLGTHAFINNTREAFVPEYTHKIVSLSVLCMYICIFIPTYKYISEEFVLYYKLTIENFRYFKC